MFVSPVGRLDLDTSGLLLMTNDNQLAERVTNPESHRAKDVPRESVAAGLTDEQLQHLRDGVTIVRWPNASGTRHAASATLRSTRIFEITLTEGRNRQVRRMIDVLGAQSCSSWCA